MGQPKISQNLPAKPAHSDGPELDCAMNTVRMKRCSTLFTLSRLAHQSRQRLEEGNLRRLAAEIRKKKFTSTSGGDCK